MKHYFALLALLLSASCNAATTTDTMRIERTSVGSVADEPFRLVVTDRQTIAQPAFLIGMTSEVWRFGGTGNREAAQFRVNSRGANPGDMLVGANGVSNIVYGSGSAFGLNAYAWVDAAADQSAEAAGMEVNTDVRRPINRKIGIQIIDVSTSTGYGAAFDSAILIGSQPGGTGYVSGLMFGIGDEAGIREGGTLIASKPSAKVFRAGMDFSGLNFSQAPVLLKPGMKGIYWGWGKEGGAVVSETTRDAGDIVFGAGITAIRFGNAATFQSTPQDTYVTVRTVNEGSLVRRLIAGPPNSAGPGYRTLTVEN